MEVQIKTLDGCQSLRHDFLFLQKLVDALSQPLGTDSVFFPNPVGGLCESEVVCHTEYVEYEPTGFFTFFSTRLGMKMSYRAEVSLRTYLNGRPGLQLVMRPTGKLNKKIYPAITSRHASYACVVAELVKNYATGSAFRKIVSHNTVAPSVASNKNALRNPLAPKKM